VALKTLEQKGLISHGVKESKEFDFGGAPKPIVIDEAKLR